MSHGHFYWNELMTPDTETAKAFYASTIGWTYEAMSATEGSTYWVAQMDGKAVGGIMDMTGVVPAGTPPHWIGYVEVSDLAASLAALTAAGGTIHREPFDVPTVGRIAIVADPAGAVMGWITPEGS